MMPAAIEKLPSLDEREQKFCACVSAWMSREIRT